MRQARCALGAAADLCGELGSLLQAAGQRIEELERLLVQAEISAEPGDLSPDLGDRID